MMVPSVIDFAKTETGFLLGLQFSAIH